VVNTQRDRVYAERRRALLSDNLAPAMIEYAERTCDDILEVRFMVAAASVVCMKTKAVEQHVLCEVAVMTSWRCAACGYRRCMYA
jgi:preprotein translocase subunit SecA